MSSLIATEQQIKICNNAIRQLDLTDEGEPCPPTGFIDKQCGLARDEDRGVRAEPAAEEEQNLKAAEEVHDLKPASATFISKSARKRSKKRASNKRGVMNIVDFCYVLAKNGGGGDARPPPEITEEGQLVNGGAAKSLPSTQQTISSNSSYASIVSGKGSQDSFFIEPEPDTAIEMEAKAVQAVHDMKTVAQQTGQRLSEKELKEQETQVGVSVAAKRDVAIQADLGKIGMRMMDKRTLGTMTEADQKMETDEKAVGAKLCGCEDGDGIPNPVEFLGNQFRFESALEVAVAGLGITFQDRAGESDVKNYESSESELSEYMCPSQF